MEGEREHWWHPQEALASFQSLSLLSLGQLKTFLLTSVRYLPLHTATLLFLATQSIQAAALGLWAEGATLVLL